MPFSHSSKNKHKKKHKKEKSKKHKREKSKKHKKEKSRSKNYSSTSNSSSDSEKEEWVESAKLDNHKHSEWGFLETALNDSNVTVKDKKTKKTNQCIEMPGQSSRELNPYWANGGSGLPEEFCTKKSEMKPRSNCDDSKLATSLNSSLPSGNEDGKHFSYLNSETKKSSLNFLKPGENISVEGNKNTYKRNWKKREQNLLDSNPIKEKTNLEDGDSDKKASASNTLTNDELNNLAAKLVKAEILGDEALIEKLKAQLDAAKESKHLSSTSMESQGQGKIKGVVIVTEGNNKRLKEPVKENNSRVQSKKQKIDTHHLKERICYFPDDDKYSLKNLFEKEKREYKEDILLTSKTKITNPDELDDVYLEAAASKNFLEKQEKIQNKNFVKEAMLRHTTLEKCQRCLDNRSQTKHLIVSTGLKCYLCLPEEESLNKGHCLIVPLQHEISTRHLDEDVWDEMKNYQKALTKMFLEQEQDVVFFENARAFKHFPHCFVQCVPLDKEMGDVAPIYFQKALLESETEWSDNKKVIDFRSKDLRKSIPKGLPYFAIDFGNTGGFAHIIEDEHLFSRNFAEEIIGGMMDLDPKMWRKPQKENFRAQRSKALEFLKMWKKFEFNERSRGFSSDSDSSSSE